MTLAIAKKLGILRNMDIQTFADTAVDQLSSEHMRALWLDLQGDWDGAHKVVQSLSDENAMWIHAYLHRKEPDISNARYWYFHAGKPFPQGQSFDEEAAVILAALV